MFLSTDIQDSQSCFQVILPLFLIMMLLSFVLLSTGLSFAKADKTLQVDATSNYGVWEGWGVSLAWWAKAFGDRDDLATLFFTTKTQSVGGRSLPGLGFNIARYNAGATSFKPYQGQSMVASPNIGASRQIDAYWLDWASADPTSSSWDWSVDANQRAMLQKAQANGADTFELFSNSPVWWMCKNHNPSGSPKGTTDNLQEWNYNSHAIYLANIAAYAKQHWGIDFQSVEAFNEPSSAYWSDMGSQEGCHFEVSTMDKVIAYLAPALSERKLSAFVAASDETAYDLAVSTWNTLTTQSKNTISRINVHGYQGGGGRRDVLYSQAKAANKRLWNSEYGDGDGTGQSMFTNMALDFTWLHPTAWVYWQAIDITGWGLLVGNNDDGSISGAEDKYFVLAQLSRHIRAGMTILTTPDANTIVAHCRQTNKLVIVAANWGSAQTIQFDLTKFSKHGVDGAVVPRWSTQISGADQYAAYRDVHIKGGVFSAAFTAGQVQTFEVGGISI